MFFAVANTFANTFYMQTNGFGKLHWYLNHSHSCGLNRVIRVYHYPVLQVMAERLFQWSLPDHCMNRYNGKFTNSVSNLIFIRVLLLQLGQ